MNSGESRRNKAGVYGSPCFTLSEFKSYLVRHKDVLGPGSFVDGWEIEVSEWKRNGKVQRMLAERRLRESVGKEYRAAKLALPKRGMDLWEWIKHKLNFGHNIVVVNRDHFMREVGIKETMYKAAVKSLVDGKFIEVVPDSVKRQAGLSGVRDIYLVNPRYVFLGNLADAYPEKVVVRAGKSKKSGMFAPGSTHAPK